MTIISGKSSNFNAALAASLLFHLVAFGVIAAVQSKVQTSVINEYIPVDLVQLPPAPRDSRPAPAVIRSAAMPRPLEAPTPVVNKERHELAPPQVSNTVSPLPLPHNEAPPAGSLLQSRSAAVPGDGDGAAGRSTGSAVPSGSRVGAPQPKNRDKGSYLAFHRLTRLPLFKSRAEPVYPNSERMTGNEARVLAEIYLNERGTVDDVTIKKSGGKLFDKAVIDAARQSSFHPGYMGEKAVPTVIQIPYSFKLK
jgi:TonB family protein